MKSLKYLIAIVVFFGFTQIALSQKEFSIKDNVFESGVEAVTFLDFFSNEEGVLQLKITPGTNATIPIRNGNMTYFGYGAIHRWLGKNEIEGYVFEGDTINPLVFKVVKDKGYTYVKGKGTIKKPDGTIIIFPLKK
jgi:hypothetical protein